MRHVAFATLLAASLLVLASPAQAIYLATPLTVSPDKAQADVGDEIVFAIAPANESEAQRFAGRTLRAEFAYDGDGERATSVTGVLGDVTLDGKAAGALRWTIPAGADDKNVFITLFDGEEGVGAGHVAVGDAPPMLMAATGGPEASTGEPVPENRVEDAPEQRGTPFAGPALLVAALGAAAFLALRRR